MFQFLISFLALVSFTIVKAQPFKYASLSWNEVSHDSSTGVYMLNHCGGFFTSDYPSTTNLTLGATLTPTDGMGALGFKSGASSAVTCQITQIYNRGTFICCGSTSVSLPRTTSQPVTYTDPDLLLSIRTVIPASPTTTASPRFVDVVAHGLLYINFTKTSQDVLQLPVYPSLSGSSSLSYQLASSTPQSGAGVINTAVTVTPSGFVQVQLPNSFTGTEFGTFTFSVTGIGSAGSQVLLSYQVATNQSLLNTAPTLGNTTEQLATVTAGKYYLQQKTHSFMVSASDADGDQVSLFPTNVTWPANATITPLFTPYVLPNTINCTTSPNITLVFNETTQLNDTVVTGNITTCTASPPEFTDIGYPIVDGPSLFRIDYTPSHDDAVQNKTWYLCYSARDQRDLVSWTEACFAIYVPKPCPTFDTSLVNGNPAQATFVLPVVSDDYVVTTTATWTCADNYGIQTVDGTTVNRASGSSFQATCQTTGWNATTSVTCKALCDPGTIAPHNGAVSISTLRMEGDAITYSCDFGYTSTTLTQTYTCNSTHGFNPAERPNCIPVPCPALTIGNGTVDVVNGTDKTTANVACNQGYGLVGGLPVATCSKTGLWQDVGQCDPVPCAPLVLPPDASFENDVTANNKTLGTLIIQCPPNWTRTGTFTTTCQVDGTWTPFDATCIPTCLVGEVIPSGDSASVQSFSPTDYVNAGTLVYPQCTATNRLYNGASGLACVEDTTHGPRKAIWNTTKGSCDPICPLSNLSNPSGTYYIGTAGIAEPTVLSSYAFPGLDIYSTCTLENGGGNGIQTWICSTAGVWQSSTACQGTCPIPTFNYTQSITYDNVFVTPTQQYLRFGESLNIACVDDYTLAPGQLATIACANNGSLIPPPLVAPCIHKTCPTLTLPANVTMVSNNATSLPQSLAGSYPLACAPGNIPSAQTAVAVCQSNYTWASVTLICTPIPPTSPPTPTPTIPTNTTTEPPTTEPPTTPPTPSPTPGPSPTVAHETTSAWTNLNIALVTIGICLGLLIIIALVWLHHSNQCKCLRKNHKATVARIDGEHAAASASVGALSAGAAAGAAANASPAASVAPSPAAASRPSPVAGGSDIEFAEVVTTGARNDPVESDYVIVLTGGGVKPSQTYEHQTIDVVANVDDRLPIG